MNLAEKHKHNLRFSVALKHYKYDLYASYNGLSCRKSDALTAECGFEGMTVEECISFIIEDLGKHCWITAIPAEDFRLETAVL